MLIRAFTFEDYQPSIDLWSRIEGLGLNESDTPGAISAFLDRNPGFSAVATDTVGNIIGTILCGHNGRAGSIQHLAVAVEYRGQGIAKRLLDYAFEHLAEAGIPRCNIFVYNDNHEGNAFWLNNDWSDPTTWRVLQKPVALAPDQKLGS
jgi:N-acetylglutamate synthase